MGYKLGTPGLHYFILQISSKSLEKEVEFLELDVTDMNLMLILLCSIDCYGAVILVKCIIVEIALRTQTKVIISLFEQCSSTIIILLIM